MLPSSQVCSCLPSACFLWRCLLTSLLEERESLYEFSLEIVYCARGKVVEMLMLLELFYLKFCDWIDWVMREERKVERGR